MSLIKSCPFTIRNENLRILWEITDRCNMNCKHCLGCDVDNRYKHQELKFKIIEKICKEIGEDDDVREIWISGGEPLLRIDLLKIIDLLYTNGKKVSLSTNGTLINSDMAKKLKESGIEYVHLSLDGVTANIHDNMRNIEGAYDKTIQAITYLHIEGIRTGITYMVTADSIDDVYAMISFAEDMNISVVSFYLIEPLGRGVVFFDNRKLLMLKLNEIEKKVGFESHKIKIEFFRITAGESNDYLEKCSADRFFTITSDGHLTGCPWLAHSGRNKVDVSLLQYSFKDAKHIVQYEMKKIISDNFHEKKCNDYNCNKELCGKGCIALMDDSGHDYLCECFKKCRQ